MPNYKVSYKKYTLKFNQPAKTSRDTLFFKDTWILKITDTGKNITGTGECSTIPGLSIDDEKQYENILKKIAEEIENDNKLDLNIDIRNFPSIVFGLETAVADLKNGGSYLIFENDFSKGKKFIPINGLVWMSDIGTMKTNISKKIKEGFKCIKLKIGAFNFEDELSLIKFIRDEYPADIEIRLDANGAYNFEDVPAILEKLSFYNIHSIEQPVKAGQWDKMAYICLNSPIPVALDEELIGITKINDKKSLLDKIKPQYIVLKPSLIGGFISAEEWINLTTLTGSGWWATSALESNIGLNAISQWVSKFDLKLAQGLGTGILYENNFQSPLVVESGYLKYDLTKNRKFQNNL